MKEKFSRRDFLKIASAAAAGSILAGCAPAAAPVTEGKSESKPASAPASQEKKKITFTMFGHPGLIEQMVPKFNEQFPDIEMTFERSEGQGYDEKLAAAIAGGTAWDCFRITAANAARFGTKGAILDLKPMQDADKVFPEAEYLDGVLKTFEIQGKRYGIPTWASCYWVYFNKKLFDEAGVPYITSQTTWDEYVAITKKLTKSDSNGNIIQYGAAGYGGWWGPISQHVWSAGGHWYYNDQLTEFKVDDPETISAIQSEADMMNKDKVHPSPLNPPTTPATIMSGKVATEINGDWYPWDQKDAWKEEFDAVQLPLVNGKRVNTYGADPLVVSAASKAPEAAYRWISWFACDKQATMIQGRVVFPVNKKGYTDPEIMKGWLQSPRPPTQIKEALEHTKTAKWWRVEPHAPEFENTVLGPNMDKIWRNVAPVEETLKTITAKGNELIKKPIE